MHGMLPDFVVDTREASGASMLTSTATSVAMAPQEPLAYAFPTAVESNVNL